MAARFSERKSFAVPAGAGSYAPERITFGSASTSVPNAGLLGVTAVVESYPANAVLELWLLKIGGIVGTDADYFLYKSITVGGETWPLASYPSVQLRVKSGGTSGTMVVNATAD